MKKNIFILLLWFAIVPIFGQSALFTVNDGYLSRHDIVYLDPDYEGYNAFPLGNGDMGGMLWLTENGIRLQINKIDLYDKPQNGNMTLRSAGQLQVDFGVPCMDYLYLKNFEARLSLWNAMSTIKAETPFFHLNIESWLDTDSNVWVIDCETADTSSEGSSPTIAMERWGSRDFGGWYGGYNKDTSDGLGKACASIKDKDILLNETFDGGLTYCMACRVLSGNTSAYLKSERRGEITTEREKKHHFQILVSIATSNETPDPQSKAVDLLNKAASKGIVGMREKHVNHWHDFWKKSFVHLGNDYMENIYYLRRYLMASSSQGRYLSPFNGGLWVWNRDIRQWVTPHHWNTQESYWGLAEQNDCDLLHPYINTYYRLMPQAEAYAASRGIKEGILWTEAHDFSGKMVSAQWSNMVNNFTPASQIASIFWDYYKYTDNVKCLQDTVYPFMKKAAEFYLQYLKWDEKKKEYYIFPSQPYEHEYNNGLRNCITDRYMIESLFKHCIEAARLLRVDAPKITAWQQVIDHLWQPPILNVPGIGELFGLAYKPDGSLYPSPEDYSKYQFYHFDAHTTAVFPADVLGLDQQGSHYFDIAKRIALRHPARVNAITPGPVVAARLGLSDKVEEHLGNMIAYLQHFNQGLFYNLDHWFLLSPYAQKVDSADLIAQRDYIFDLRVKYNKPGTGNSGLWSHPFVQCGMETLGIFGTAVNEMLMQSHEGKIRIFPATPSHWDTAFTLLAQGAFIVSASKDKNDKVRGVEIISKHGNPCRLQNPWPSEKFIIKSDGKRVKYHIDNKDVISFTTKKNARYLLSPEKGMNSPIKIFVEEINEKPKHFRTATLGKDRTYKR